MVRTLRGDAPAAEAIEATALAARGLRAREAGGKRNMATALAIAGLVLCLVHLIQSNGQSILGWAVLLLALSLALPILPIR